MSSMIAAATRAAGSRTIIAPAVPVPSADYAFVRRSTLWRSECGSKFCYRCAYRAGHWARSASGERCAGSGQPLGKRLEVGVIGEELRRKADIAARSRLVAGRCRTTTRTRSGGSKVFLLPSLDYFVLQSLVLNRVLKFRVGEPPLDRSGLIIIDLALYPRDGCPWVLCNEPDRRVVFLAVL